MSSTTAFPALIGPRSSAPDLVLKGVGHTYRSAQSQPVLALTATDLTIDGGAVVALVGPAESGKSTLLEILAGRQLPTEGDVFLAGVPVVGPGRRGIVIQPSGAEDLRAQLAQALAEDPDLLLFDEPFAAVSGVDRERLQEELRAIWQEAGKTMVLASRSAAAVVPLATRVIVLSPGQGDIVQDVHVDFAQRDQPLDTVLADPSLARFTARLQVA